MNRAGGIEVLASEVAEDAAATKVVRGAGRKVQLVDRPFPQPLGYRTAAEVWHRQVRWARLRRASFFAYFLPEAVSGGVLPMIALAVVAPAFGLPVVPTVLLFAYFGMRRETLLAAVAGWHVSARYPLIPVCARRSCPCCFFSALQGDDFVWRGNEMQVERLRPRGMMARMRPRLTSGAARTPAASFIARADVLIDCDRSPDKLGLLKTAPQRSYCRSLRTSEVRRGSSARTRLHAQGKH